MVVLYDLKMASHTDANKPKGSVTLLNSTYSTLISSDGSEIEVFPITDNNIYYICFSNSNKIYTYNKKFNN